MALALLWAQAVGLAHRIQHAPGVSDAGRAEQRSSLGHVPQSAECRLYDHLVAGDASPVTVLALPPNWGKEAPTWTGESVAVAATWEAFRARAPPRYG